mgnify:CR=1 FL=1
MYKIIEVAVYIYFVQVFIVTCYLTLSLAMDDSSFKTRKSFIKALIPYPFWIYFAFKSLPKE